MQSYFEQINERPLRDLMQAANSLRNCVEEPQMYESVVKSVEHLQIAWSKVMSKAPAHITNIQFGVEKEALANLLKEIQREVAEEEMMLGRQENPSLIANRNKNLLNGNIPVQAKRSLERLKQVEQRFSVNYPNEGQGLRDQLNEAEDVFQSLIQRAHTLNNALLNIPQQWNIYKQK